MTYALIFSIFLNLALGAVIARQNQLMDRLADELHDCKLVLDPVDAVFYEE